jgi:uncharacterized membrane protein YccC
VTRESAVAAVNASKSRCTIAFREVNYALFAMLLTALIVYSQEILGAGAAESGMDRLSETVLGVAVAFFVLGLNEALTRARNSAD